MCELAQEMPTEAEDRIATDTRFNRDIRQDAHNALEIVYNALDDLKRLHPEARQIALCALRTTF